MALVDGAYMVRRQMMTMITVLLIETASRQLMMRQKVTILADDYDAYNNNSFTPYGYIIRYIFCLHKHYFLKYTVTQFS